ncbi:unnamed protein product [Arabis nemorensis]|uniref:Uncharacterized protein n=1 Tax=Arabis nemorensis TaxID=586526 RepID=A0A565B041_9BRAS|nr:unnamed protein product [Arabis nemorensis]
MIRFYVSDHHLQFDDSYLLYPNRQRSVDALRESLRAQVDSALSLLQQGNNGIKKLSLQCEDDDFEYLWPHTNRWISNAVEQGVSDLDLRFKTPIISGEEGYHFMRLLPCSLFRSKTLVKLTLGTETCIGHNPLPMVVVSLPVLKSLFLHTV